MSKLQKQSDLQINRTRTINSAIGLDSINGLELKHGYNGDTNALQIIDATGATTYTNNTFKFGGTASNYASTTKDFAPGANTWVLEWEMLYNGTTVILPVLFTTGYSIAIVASATGNSTLLVYLSSNGTSWNLVNGTATSHTFAARPTGMLFRLTFDGTQYILAFNKGSGWINTFTFNSTTPLYQVGQKLIFGKSTIGTSRYYSASAGLVATNNPTYETPSLFIAGSSVNEFSNISPNNHPVITAGSCLGVNGNHIELALDFNDRSLSGIYDGINDYGIIPFGTHTTVEAGAYYSTFIYKTISTTDILFIHNKAQTDGILTSEAITAINTALGSDIIDYRYLGDLKLNNYTSPYLEYYVKKPNGNIQYEDNDLLNGYYNIDGSRNAWTRTTLTGVTTNTSY